MSHISIEEGINCPDLHFLWKAVFVFSAADGIHASVRWKGETKTSHVSVLSWCDIHPVFQVHRGHHHRNLLVVVRRSLSGQHHCVQVCIWCSHKSCYFQFIAVVTTLQNSPLLRNDEHLGHCVVFICVLLTWTQALVLTVQNVQDIACALHFSLSAGAQPE